jgi:hypothetical protein
MRKGISVPLPSKLAGFGKVDSKCSMFSFGCFPGVCQTPGKHTKENILHVKHGESLKSRIDSKSSKK